MLNAAFSCVGGNSVHGKPTHSADRPTLASSTEQQRADLHAHKKGRLPKHGGRVPSQGGAANLQGDAEERAALPVGSANRRQANMQRRAGEWRYRMTLSRANRIAALGQMSASIVHEINQPAAAVVINAQAALRFLEGLNPNLEEVRQALTRIARLGNRVVEVVRHTCALVQRTPRRTDDFEINEAIGETIALSKGQLFRNAVSVHTRFASGLPLVRADRIQVQQVMLNLITNAVEAMSRVSEAGRKLRIITGRNNAGEILVTVQDSGPGLGVRNPDRVFDAFYSTKPSGLGIGLSICRSIVESHDGRLWASRGKPHGATFQFTLPVSEPAPAGNP